MLDPKLLRENLDEVADKLLKRGFVLDKEKYKTLEEQRKHTQYLRDSCAQEKRILSKLHHVDKQIADLTMEASIHMGIDLTEYLKDFCEKQH